MILFIVSSVNCDKRFPTKQCIPKLHETKVLHQDHNRKFQKSVVKVNVQTMNIIKDMQRTFSIGVYLLIYHAFDMKASGWPKCDFWNSLISKCSLHFGTFIFTSIHRHPSCDLPESAVRPVFVLARILFCVWPTIHTPPLMQWSQGRWACGYNMCLGPWARTYDHVSAMCKCQPTFTSSYPQHCHCFLSAHV